MNITVLNQYKIKFEVLLVDDVKTLQITSSVIPYFWGYFIKIFPIFLIEEVIPEINKALLGQSFDEDAGGSIHYLKIGITTSFFEDDKNNQYPIPTEDVKEIILSYIEWVDVNNLERYI